MSFQRLGCSSRHSMAAKSSALEGLRFGGRPQSFLQDLLASYEKLLGSFGIVTLYGVGSQERH